MDERIKIDDDGKAWVNLGSVHQDTFGRWQATMNIGGVEKSRPCASKEEGETLIHDLLATAILGFGLRKQ
ncbi:hypothetical protein ACIQWR_18890 [Streptomyces sp. NPDC098789]|uniref:hypothetical protein n=1 Tax=Streptomyces sp. NPDC098789 TaxID=3366098 RepID=UPI003828CAF1